MNRRLIAITLGLLTLAFILISCEKKDTQTPGDENPGNETTTQNEGGLDELAKNVQETAEKAETGIKEAAGKAETAAKEAAREVQETVKEATAKMVEGFSAKDQNGNTIELADYSDKIVVLEFTNPKCPYVKRHYEADTMEQLAREYQEKGVVWLAVNSTNFQDTAFNKSWHEQQDLPYPVLNDQSGTIGKLFGAKTTPHMFIINKNGRIVYDGAIDNDPSGNKSDDATTNYVRQALDELLAGTEVSVNETKPYGCSVKYK